MRLPLAAATAVTFLAVSAPGALAAPTASFTNGAMTVTGDTTAETYTVSETMTDLVVTGPAGMQDPDGALGAACTNTSTTSSCSLTAVESLTVDGAAGTDTLSATSDVDVPTALNGSDDVDTLTKNTFAATLDGGAGNDKLNAGTGSLEESDTGGMGDDTFTGGSRQDSFVAEPGNDVYHGGTTPATGFAAGLTQVQFAADSINYAGTLPVTVTLDGVANDGRANETDNVGTDVESVRGSSMADKLTAGASGAALAGAAGDDTLVGGPGGDQLDGGTGTDTLTANDGDDRLFDGDDDVPVHRPSDGPLTAPGNDKLSGGAGNDLLQAVGGADDLAGGAGNDVAVLTRYQTIEVADTAPDPDDVDAPETVSLDDVANDGVTGASEGKNVHADVEEIDTAGGNDTISGSPGPNTAYTAGGDDRIDLGAGADLVDAGTGNDTIAAVDQTTDRVECGDGADTATADLPGGQPERADVLFDCETVSGTPFPAPPAPTTVTTTTTTPAPPTPKPVAPVVTLGGVTSLKVKAFLGGGALPVRVTCDVACAVSGEVVTTQAKVAKVGQLAVGSGSLPLGTGTRTLTVKVSSTYLKSFKRKLKSKQQVKKGITLSVVLTSTSADGLATTSTRAFTVKG